MLRIVAITASVALALSTVFVVLGLLTTPRADRYCADETQAFPATGVAGWRGDQLENAAIIVQTARAMGIEREGQIIGVMAAMGESSLHNIGLFQQQSWWGTAEERMDPATAATKFFTRLDRIAGWEELPPSHAINRVQINADREHYARFQDDATSVVDALSGTCAR